MNFHFLDPHIIPYHPISSHDSPLESSSFYCTSPSSPLESRLGFCIDLPIGRASHAICCAHGTVAPRRKEEPADIGLRYWMSWAHMVRCGSACLEIVEICWNWRMTFNKMFKIKHSTIRTIQFVTTLCNRTPHANRKNQRLRLCHTVSMGRGRDIDHW